MWEQKIEFLSLLKFLLHLDSVSNRHILNSQGEKIILSENLYTHAQRKKKKSVSLICL